MTTQRIYQDILLFQLRNRYSVFVHLDNSPGASLYSLEILF